MTDETGTDGTDAERVEALFTRSEGAFRFARWARPLAPVIAGTDEKGEATFTEALKAVAGLGGLDIVEEDPELGRNFIVVFTGRWAALNDIPALQQLVPDLEKLTSVLAGAGANQYRIYDFDDEGAIRLCITLLCFDEDLAKMPAQALAANQSVQAMLLWSDTAFMGESPVQPSPLGTRAEVTPFYRALIRAAYAEDMPASSEDPALAARLAARMQDAA
jgi:hypothetical protein